MASRRVLGFRTLTILTWAAAFAQAPANAQAAPPDTKVLDNYVGIYQMLPSMTLTIERDGTQMYAQLTGQPQFAIVPDGEHSFAVKVVDAELTFKTDAQGKATEVTLHQNGSELPGKRIDAAQAAASAAALEKKVKDQTQDVRTEAALRRSIGELKTGEPKYELMTPAIAAITRQQLPQLQGAITDLGALQSVKFTGVGPAGADIYDVKFEKGATEWRIMLDADGKVASIGFRPE